MMMNKKHLHTSLSPCTDSCTTTPGSEYGGKLMRISLTPNRSLYPGPIQQMNDEDTSMKIGKQESQS